MAAEAKEREVTCVACPTRGMCRMTRSFFAPPPGWFLVAYRAAEEAAMACSVECATSHEHKLAEERG